jgi:5-methylcytosine-specific restriction protein A
MAKRKRPTWLRDELILALDLYFKHDRNTPPAKHPDVIELSQLLNRLPLIPLDQRDDDFRNPTSVIFKLLNFRWIDPARSGGYERGGMGDRAVRAEFSNDREGLNQTAAAIREFATSEEAATPVDIDTEVDEASEGKILLRVHFARERNQAIVKRRKDKALEDFGKLECEVCGFDFGERYGELGQGFIECHHIVPLSALTQERRTVLSDLALVSSNCHRMIHRSKLMISVQGLRAILRNDEPFLSVRQVLEGESPGTP